MPFAEVNIAKEREMLKELIESDMEAQKAVEDFDREYESRKKLVLAGSEAKLVQEELRAI